MVAPNLKVAPVRASLPDPTGVFTKLSPEGERYMLELHTALQRELARRHAYDEPMPYLLMFSPDGTVWKISVTNAGVVRADPPGELPPGPP